MARPKSWESWTPDSQALKACKTGIFGRLAQLGEHQLDKLGVTGSSPVPPIRRKPLLTQGFLA